MTTKAIVLDANILIRAVLGNRVRDLIFHNAGTVKFFAPAVAYADARKYLPGLLKKRGISIEPTLAILDILESVVQRVDEGRRRLARPCLCDVNGLPSVDGRR